MTTWLVVCLVLWPLATAAAALVAPVRWLRAISVAGAACGAGAGIALAATIRHTAEIVGEVVIPLAPQAGYAVHLGVDGLSAVLLALCGVVQVIAVLASSWEHRPRAYAVLLALVAAGTNLVFTALDWISFISGWELLLLPMFLLIAIWGGEQRRAAAVKFVVYTLGGSLAMLVVLVALPAATPRAGVLAEVPPHVVAAHGRIGPGWSYPMAALVDPAAGAALLASQSRGAGPTVHGLPLLVEAGGVLAPADSLRSAGRLVVVVPRSLEILHHQLLWRHWAGLEIAGLSAALLGFLALALACGVKVPVLGLHTWLPHAHVQAPTAISVLLAALLLKLGVYGLLRTALPIFPGAALDAAGVIAVIGAAAVLIAGWIALAQTDLKRLVAYSSVSHMGWCLIGLAAATAGGLTGAGVQMVTHGLGSALLFLLVGVLYDRAHHRRVDGFGGLAAPMPRFAGALLFACLAGAALPATAGFVGEFLVILGGVASPAGGGWVRGATLAACCGVIITAAYLLSVYRRIATGPLPQDTAAASWPDLTRRELACIAPLVALILVLGVWPRLVVDRITPWAELTAQHLAWVEAAR
jgi:NADH-quinone oxidoreductase subunit M